MKTVCICFLLVVQFFSSPAYELYDSARYHLSVELTLRPRAEVRKNYFFRPEEPLQNGLYATQRNELAMVYQKSDIKLVLELQEIHLWAGKQGLTSTVGSIHMANAYLDLFHQKKFSLRMGRQGISLDNGRIFSDAPWAQQGRSHEGIAIFYRSAQKTWQSSAYCMFTRNYQNHFNPRYSPVGSHRYKYLAILENKFQVSKTFLLRSIIAADFFNEAPMQNSFRRLTAGGSMHFKKEPVALVTRGYFQMNQPVPAQRAILGHYFQAEARFTEGKTTVAIGGELLDGHPENQQNSTIRSFDVLYGVAWKFMGNMNFFTNFPRDVAGNGLLNPYFLVQYSPTHSLTLSGTLHTFHTRQPVLCTNGYGQGKRFLGLEQDLSLKQQISKAILLQAGYSFFIPEAPMRYLNKIQHENRLAFWYYLMVTFKVRGSRKSL